MAAMGSGLQRLAIRLSAVFWFALLLFGLLGLGVIHVLPSWMLADEPQAPAGDPVTR